MIPEITELMLSASRQFMFSGTRRLGHSHPKIGVSSL